MEWTCEICGIPQTGTGTMSGNRKCCITCYHYDRVQDDYEKLQQVALRLVEDCQEAIVQRDAAYVRGLEDAGRLVHDAFCVPSGCCGTHDLIRILVKEAKGD